MHNELQLTLTPEQAFKEDLFSKQIADKLQISPKQITRIRTLKKSIDSRSFIPKVIVTVEVYWDEAAPETVIPAFDYHFVGEKTPVLIIGAGPAGLFAALKLIESGFKPIILERGKSTSERKVDIALLNRNKGIDTDSNYCFGEGGAGTFSDGKLYSRSKKKGNKGRNVGATHLYDLL